MTTEEQKSAIKNFFEKYYEMHEILTILPDVPKEMLAGEDTGEEWQKWKLIPATVSDEDIADLEKGLGIKLPDVLKIFLTTYFHLFYAPVGGHSVDEPFDGINNAWNPLLVKAGYLPFTWDKEGYFIRCIDLANMPDEDTCAVCQIDHEILFDFDEDTAGREDIEPEMEVVADNFMKYLESLLD